MTNKESVFLAKGKTERSELGMSEIKETLYQTGSLLLFLLIYVAPAVVLFRFLVQFIESVGKKITSLLPDWLKKKERRG